MNVIVTIQKGSTFTRVLVTDVEAVVHAKNIANRRASDLGEAVMAASTDHYRNTQPQPYIAREI